MKKNWIKGLLALAIVVSFAFSGNAITFSNSYSGAVDIKFSDWSNGQLYPTDSNGYGQNDGQEDAYGIFKVSTFKTPLAQTVWWDGKDGVELTGLYYGIDDDYWTVDTTGVDIKSIGGRLEIYEDASQDFDPSLGPAAYDPVAKTYTGATNGSLWLAIDFVPGIMFNNGDASDDHITYFNSLTSKTSPFTANGAFYGVVAGGSAASMFDSNQYKLESADSGMTVEADFFAQFDAEAPGDFDWLSNSEDPVSCTIVPEPISMTTMLMGIVGLFGYGIRRKN